MKVTVIAQVPDRPEVAIGGVMRATASLVQALTVAGINVDIVAPHTGTAKDVGEYAGVTVHYASVESSGGLLTGHPRFTAAALRRIDLLQPDIVQAQGVSILGQAAVKVPDRPSVVVAHGSATMDIRYSYGRLAGLPRIALVRRRCSQVVDQADAVVNVCPDWRVNLTRKPRESVWIPNIVEHEFFDTRSDPSVPRILFLGGSRRVKGVDLLARAFAAVRRAVPHAWLELYGATDDEFGVVLGRSVPPGIRLCGTIAPSRVREVLAGGGVCVVPSRYEVSPILVGESWAAGVPVIANRVGGLVAMAQGPEQSGAETDSPLLLCDPSAEELAHALIDALRSDELRASLVAAGRMRAERYRAERVVPDYLGLYERLLGREASGSGDGW